MMEEIGSRRLRRTCPRFDEWMTKSEGLKSWKVRRTLKERISSIASWKFTIRHGASRRFSVLSSMDQILNLVSSRLRTGFFPASSKTPLRP
jgi:hypothetical protein